MKLHYGAIPEDLTFHPEESGWRGIREPGPVAIQFYAIPAAFFLLAVWALLLASAAPLSHPDVFLRELNRALPPLSAALAMILILPLVIVHELLHALAAPGWGMTPATQIGVWPSRGLFYAHHDGEMPRNRFLVIFALPYLMLGCLPLAPLFLFGPSAWSTGWGILLLLTSFFGSLLACGDLIGFLLVLAQIPARAIIRNKGWKTYWRMPS